MSVDCIYKCALWIRQGAKCVEGATARGMGGWTVRGRSEGDWGGLRLDVAGRGEEWDEDRCRIHVVACFANPNTPFRPTLTGYVLTLTSTAVQLLALLWYLVSFMPGGEAGMKVVTGAIGKVLGPIVGGCAFAGRKCCEAVIRSATG